jgi:DNA repair exonuclease SbcCD nuclease subunit
LKVAVVGDAHLGCTTYTDKRASDFSKKFNLVAEKALEHRAEVVFLLGDVFDSTAYRRSVESFAGALSEVADSFVKLKQAGAEIFAIAGNHEYGRGRTGGELRILSDLGIIRFLNDEVQEYNGLRIGGISWKSKPDSFRETLKRLGTPGIYDVLLIHQFCEGSRFIPPFKVEVRKSDLAGWGTVFTGHHHHYEDLGYVLVPGSLEVHEANELGQKGFVLFDTDSRKHEFVGLPPSRAIHFTEFSGDGKSASQFQQELEAWIDSNASAGALLVARIDGALSTGRSIDIDWRGLRARSYQAGCIKLYFEGGLRDQVRTAPEIRATVNLQEFLRTRFGKDAERAIRYTDSLRENGDEFYSQVLEEILKAAQKGQA